MRAMILMVATLLCFSCANTVKPSERWITLSELTSDEWTEVSIECYNVMVRDESVVGMISNGRYMLQLVIREEI